MGRLHVLTATWRELEDVFVGLGFTVVEGPEVETVHYNFDALNHSPTHPARDRTDTFYVSDDVVLRTHTSPMQARAKASSVPLRSASVMSSSTARPSTWWNIGVCVASLSRR